MLATSPPALTTIAWSATMVDLSLSLQDESVQARFWPKVDRRGPDECWPWSASDDGRGYGLFWVNGKNQRAHRVAYQLLVGPVPEGLELDHLCRNRICVNPAHLDPVPHRVNMLRSGSPVASQAKQTHCHRGHPLSGKNLYVDPRGRRDCRKCKSKPFRRAVEAEAMRTEIARRLRDEDSDYNRAFNNGLRAALDILAQPGAGADGEKEK